MATAINAYVGAFGIDPTSPQKQGKIPMLWDFSLKPVAAGDVLNLFPVAAGTKVKGYVIQNIANPTDVAAHTAISLGLTGATTGLASAVQPSATVGTCITADTIVTNLVNTGAVYLAATFAAAQTTGQVLIDVAVETL